MPGDALDHLLDQDVFRDVDTNMDIPVRRKASPTSRAQDSAFGLGIDEEIKISKRRRPIAKLDEDRLLSQAGIPKLRRIAKERLRFKGKGHEYSDITRLLNVYQLWLDDLYPRAKFADGLAIIEKLGHTRRMQTMRREWINEAKSKDYLAKDSNSKSKPQAPVVDELGSDAQHNIASLVRAHTPIVNKEDEDKDLYSATPRKTLDKKKTEPDVDVDESLFVSDDENDKTQSEDELDALLAEVDARDKTTSSDTPVQQDPQTKSKETEPSFDDEMEAMAGMDDMW